jgi:hypothetical protein
MWRWSEGNPKRPTASTEQGGQSSVAKDEATVDKHNTRPGHGRRGGVGSSKHGEGQLWVLQCRFGTADANNVLETLKKKEQPVESEAEGGAKNVPARRPWTSLAERQERGEGEGEGEGEKEEEDGMCGD